MTGKYLVLVTALSVKPGACRQVTGEPILYLAASGRFVLASNLPAVTPVLPTPIGL